MRYVLKQDALAWGDDFHIYDSQGKEVYSVDGAAIALRNHLSFQDIQKHELACIAQSIFTWGNEYTISRSGKVAAKVSQQRFSGTQCNFFIDVPGPDDLCAEGDYYNRNYTFRRAEKIVARATKEEHSAGFGVDIFQPEDPVLILASAIVIELITRATSERGSLFQ